MNMGTYRTALVNEFKRIRRMLKDPFETRTLMNNVAKFFVGILRALILIGVSYVILSPVIGMFVNSISSNADAVDPMVFIFPVHPTLEKYKLAIERMDYFKTIGRNLLYVLSLTVIQVFICSMVGYGFARFKFPLKKLLFGCVVVMIVLPSHTIMLPLYLQFRQFNLFGRVVNLMGTPWPMYILSFLGCGVKSGLYIYIFNQFFRGLPKEIEEAALVDGAGLFYTYFAIMLRNAMPAVITVTVFSMVWQFNDLFFSSLFQVSSDIVISNKVSTLQNTIANLDKILSVTVQQLYVSAAIILVLLPIVIIYLVLQRYFIEGVERSGIVG